IKRLSDSKWFDPPTPGFWLPSGSNIWNAATTFNPANGNWTLDTSGIGLWTNLESYAIYVRAVDKAGNIQTAQLAPSTFSFTFQPPPSVVAITKPTANKLFNQNLTD